MQSEEPGPYDPQNPIDIQKGITQFGSEEIFYMMLEQYEDQAQFNQNLEKLMVALRNEDYVDIKKVGHNFKGTALYVGGVHFGHTSNILQQIIKNKLQNLEGGQLKLIKELTPEEVLDVYKNSVQLFKYAKDFKLDMGKLLKKEKDVKDIETYIQESEVLYQQKQEKYSNNTQLQPSVSLKIDNDNTAQQAKCQLCNCTIF